MKLNLIHRIVLLATLSVFPGLSAGEIVGTVVTPGRVLVNNLAVQGNASLSAGAVLKTNATAARIELIDGGALSLDASGEAVVHQASIQLRQGKSILASPAARIDALGLQISSTTSASQVLVAVADGKVEVAALRGEAKVRSPLGMTLAMVRTGKPLSFIPQSNLRQSTVTGAVRRQGAKLLITDELTGTDVELRGDGVAAQLGHRIQATGQAQITSDSENHVVLVSRLNRLDADPSSEAPPAPAADSKSSNKKKAAAATVGTAAGASTGTAAAAASTGTAAATAVAAGASAGMAAGTTIGLAALALGGMAAAIAIPISMSN